jgi:hypothetical protein
MYIPLPDYMRLALNFSGDVLWSSQFVIAVLCAACSWHADVAMVRAGGWRDFAAFVSIVSCVRQGFFSAGKILGNGASDDFESWPPFFCCADVGWWRARPGYQRLACETTGGRAICRASTVLQYFLIGVAAAVCWISTSCA